MPDNPIYNPGTSPIQPTQPVGPEKPGLPAPGSEGEERPFTIGPQPGKEGQAAPAQAKPTPMEVAGDSARQQPQMSPEELHGQVVKLQNQLSDIQQNLKKPTVTQKFTSDHYEAMQKVTQKMNPDMQTIAKNSNGTFSPPAPKSGQSVLEQISQWLNGAQGTLGGALDYLQNTKKPDITSYLRLQYAVQRATQRGELFASIVGSSVSGIKTIMSTQLG